MDGRDGNDLSKYSEREYVKGLRREGKKAESRGKTVAERKNEQQRRK